MDNQTIKANVMNSPEPDESREDSFGVIVRDLYNPRNSVILIWIWINAVVFMALNVLFAVLFFGSDGTKSQIMYAALFGCCMQVIILLKIICWQTLQRNRIVREINRLNYRIAQISVTLENR